MKAQYKNIALMDKQDLTLGKDNQAVFTKR